MAMEWVAEIESDGKSIWMLKPNSMGEFGNRDDREPDY